MKTCFRIFLVLILLLSFIDEGKGQVVEVKKWKGTYPDMEGSYPLSFIAFKGWLFPVPHVFVRTWPTHYYVEVGALPVTDGGEIAGSTQTGLLRIAAKALERYQMKGRHKETEGIKLNTEAQQEIQQKLLDYRADQLQDLFNLAARFVALYKKVEQIRSLENSQRIHRILEKESDDLLIRFLMINLMGTDHGRKLEAFSEISHQLDLLAGEVDYTHKKLHFFIADSRQPLSYSFLTQ